jgi:alpha-methylacyl-CoA racemase
MMTTVPRTGPLNGLRVVEFASIGPGPHCALLLADLGAEVLRIDRPGGTGWPNAVLDRGRHALTADIRTDEGRAVCLAATDRADILIEGNRPGVMERRGLGPEILLARNPRLVYGRVTGWGQSGPLAQAAGHDINYIALAGALASCGRPGTPPHPPLNLLGDFGAGSMFLVLGILAALHERQTSGRGQVVDAAIVDGIATMMGQFAGMPDGGSAARDRETSFLGGSAPFYRCYRCADGRFVSVGAVEPQFYAELIERIGAPREFLERQNDVSLWAERSRQLEELFARRTMREWCDLLEGSDTCFAPVLTFEEALDHAHLSAREVYARRSDHIHSAPAPRFSRTPGVIADGGDGGQLLDRWCPVETGHAAIAPMQEATTGGAVTA